MSKPAPASAPSLSRWWGVLCFVCLTLQAWYFTHLGTCATPAARIGYLSVGGGDHLSYMGAMDHLIDEGRYYFVNAHGDEVRAGRMPHFGVPYYLLRLVLPLPIASDVFVLLQVALVVWSIWLLASLLSDRPGGRWTAPLFLLVACLSGHLTPYLTRLQPDAVSVALLGLAVHRIVLMERWDRRLDTLWLGVVLGALVLAKPYFVLFFPLIAIWWTVKDRDIRRTFSRSLVLGLPLVLFLAPWWVRNAMASGRFFLFQQDLYAGYGYSAPDLRVREVLTYVGEDPSTWWNPSGMACAMKHEPFPPCTYRWPEHYSPELLAEFITLRDRYLLFQVDPTPAHSEAVLLAAQAAETAYGAEHPWRARLFNRPVLVWKFIANSGSFHLPVHPMNPCFHKGQLVFKLMASAAYWVSILGLVLTLPIFLRGRWPEDRVWLVPALYLLILFPLAMGVVEWRLFLAAFLADLWLFFRLLGTWQRPWIWLTSLSSRTDRPVRSLQAGES